MEPQELKNRIDSLIGEIRENPESDAYFPLARLYFSIKENRNAFEACVNGLKVHSQYYEGYLLLGEILIAIGQFERAEKAFATAFKLDPSRSDPLFLLCDVYIHADNLSKLTAVMHQLEIVAPYDMRLSRIRETVAQLKKEQRTEKQKTGRSPLPMTDAVKNNHADVNKIVEKPHRTAAIPDESRLKLEPAKQPVISGGREAITIPGNFDFSTFMEKLFEIDGIMGMVFINPEGQVQRSMDCDLGAAKSLAKILKSYTKAFNLSLDVLNFGKWIEVTIILDEGFVFILNLGSYKIAFQCSDEIALGSLRAKLRNILFDFKLISVI